MNGKDYEIVAETASGIIESIGEPELVETPFGKRNRIPLVIKTENGSITVSMFANSEKTVVHPKSNLYKFMRKHDVKKLSEIVGKNVNIRQDSKGFWRFDY